MNEDARKTPYEAVKTRENRLNLTKPEKRMNDNEKIDYCADKLEYLSSRFRSLKGNTGDTTEMLMLIGEINRVFTEIRDIGLEITIGSLERDGIGNAAEAGMIVVDLLESMKK